MNIRGFSLTEVLVTLSIITVLLGATAPFTLNFYRRYQSINERNLLISLFRRARTLSITRNGASDHGVHIASTQYTIFEGATFANRDQAKDQTFLRDTALTITGPADLIFKREIGYTSSVSFILDNGTKQEKISVNYAGRVDWK